MGQNIYDIFAKDGTPVLFSVTVKDIREELGCTREQVYNAVNYGYAMQGKYNVKLVDRALAKSKDMGLLVEFDVITQALLEAGRRKMDQEQYINARKRTCISKGLLRGCLRTRSAAGKNL